MMSHAASPRAAVGTLFLPWKRLAVVLLNGLILAAPLAVIKPVIGIELFVGFAGAGVVSILARERALSRRLADQDGAPWEVRAGMRTTTVIPDRDLAAIELQVFRDWRFHRDRLWTCIGHVQKAVSSLIRLGPLAVFWCLLVVVAIDPAGVAAIVANPTVDVIAGGLRAFLALLWTSAVLLASWSVLQDWLSGDDVQAALREAIRQREGLGEWTLVTLRRAPVTGDPVPPEAAT